MDGIHDLGGMHGFGPVVRDDDGQAVHQPWEAAVRAMQLTVIARRIVTVDESRYAIERMDPAAYLNSSYYERWLDGVIRSLLEKQILNGDELDERTRFFQEHPETSTVETPFPKSAPMTFNRTPSAREEPPPPRFKPGDSVVTNNIHPTHHTRLPRYARGKRGIIQTVQRPQSFPDTNAHNLGRNRQSVYTVAFAAAELWGPPAEPNARVQIDLWESYLEPA
jgi:nitrile hydratase